MKDYKSTTTDVLYQTAGLFYDYSEKSVAIWDGMVGMFILYPKTEIVVNKEMKMWGTINSVYNSSIDFTKRNFHHSFFKDIASNKKEFTFQNCINGQK
jgi:hypothetical protein